jgi:hypothetical protein
VESRTVKGLTLIPGVLALLVGAMAPTASHAQHASPAQPPSIDLTLTETLQRLSVDSAPSKEDLRDVPPPRPNRLSENVRITVIVGDPRCVPGEDGRVTGLPYSPTARQPGAR